MLFPNPVSNRLKVSLNLDKNSDCKIVIYDELGRKIGKEQVKQLYYGENLFDLNMSNLNSGIYFVSLNIDGEIVVKQIVKE